MPDNGKLRTIGKTGKIGKMGGIGKIDRIGTGNNRESTYGIKTGNYSDHPQYVVVDPADSKQPASTDTPHTGFFGRKIVIQALTYR
jgi:hypothetical protein